MKNFRILKLTASLTAICFLFTQTGFAAPALQITPRHENPAAPALSVPVELGTVDSIYQVPKSSRVILQIQNAHANYGAQLKIRELLTYLHKTYGIQAVFIEGAAEQLNPDYLQAFSNPKQNKKFLDELVQQGILDGAGLFIQDRIPGVEGLPIEDTSLYRKNYEALKKVYSAESEINRELSKIETRISKEASKQLSSELRATLSEWQLFEKGQREFLPSINRLSEKAHRVLGLDLHNVFSQANWPQITHLLALQETEKKLDLSKAQEEKGRLVEFLKSKNISEKYVLAVIPEMFNRGSINSLDSRLRGNDKSQNYRQLLETLITEARPQGFRLADWPAFTTWAAYLIQKQELDAQKLHKEIEVLFTKLIDALAKTKEQKRLVALYQDFALFTKLLHLELSRSEFAEFQKRKITPAHFMSEIAASLSAPRNDSQSKMSSLRAERSNLINYYQSALEFYAHAIDRDQMFYQKLDRQMRDRGITKAAIVTGGFHTEGLTDIFRKEKTSFAVLTPHISEIEGSKIYRDVMLGTKPLQFQTSFLAAAQRAQSHRTLTAMGFSRFTVTNSMTGSLSAKSELRSEVRLNVGPTIGFLRKKFKKSEEQELSNQFHARDAKALVSVREILAEGAQSILDRKKANKDGEGNSEYKYQPVYDGFKKSFERVLRLSQGNMEAFAEVFDSEGYTRTHGREIFEAAMEAVQKLAQDKGTPEKGSSLSYYNPARYVYARFAGEKLNLFSDSVVNPLVNRIRTQANAENLSDVFKKRELIDDLVKELGDGFGLGRQSKDGFQYVIEYDSLTQKDGEVYFVVRVLVDGDKDVAQGVPIDLRVVIPVEGQENQYQSPYPIRLLAGDKNGYEVGLRDSLHFAKTVFPERNFQSYRDILESVMQTQKKGELKSFIRVAHRSNMTTQGVLTASMKLDSIAPHHLAGIESEKVYGLQGGPWGIQNLEDAVDNQGGIGWSPAMIRDPEMAKLAQQDPNRRLVLAWEADHMRVTAVPKEDGSLTAEGTPASVKAFAGNLENVFLSYLSYLSTGQLSSDLQDEGTKMSQKRRHGVKQKSGESAGGETLAAIRAVAAENKISPVLFAEFHQLYNELGLADNALPSPMEFHFLRNTWLKRQFETVGTENGNVPYNRLYTEVDFAIDGKPHTVDEMMYLTMQYWTASQAFGYPLSAIVPSYGNEHGAKAGSPNFQLANILQYAAQVVTLYGEAMPEELLAISKKSPAGSKAKFIALINHFKDEELRDEALEILNAVQERTADEETRLNAFQLAQLQKVPEDVMRAMKAAQDLAMKVKEFEKAAAKDSSKQAELDQAVTVRDTAIQVMKSLLDTEIEKLPVKRLVKISSHAGSGTSKEQLQQVSQSGIWILNKSTEWRLMMLKMRHILYLWHTNRTAAQEELKKLPEIGQRLWNERISQISDADLAAHADLYAKQYDGIWEMTKKKDPADKVAKYKYDGALRSIDWQFVEGQGWTTLGNDNNWFTNSYGRYMDAQRDKDGALLFPNVEEWGTPAVLLEMLQPIVAFSLEFYHGREALNAEGTAAAFWAHQADARATTSSASQGEGASRSEVRKEWFPKIRKVKYVGPNGSSDQLAFQWYDESAVIGGKTMKEWLNFSAAAWHLNNSGGDPFGPGTKEFPWLKGLDDQKLTNAKKMLIAKRRARAMFEFMVKMGIPNYAFHDRDIAPAGKNPKESKENLWEMARFLKKLQKETGIKLLWGTANLFSHPKFMNGAATNPDMRVFLSAAGQVKEALEVTKFLGGSNYVLWGGREGYYSLLNTKTDQEKRQLAIFLRMVRDHARKIGFQGKLLIEPKPHEPTGHQYDRDVAAVLDFLRQNHSDGEGRKFNLFDDFALNIEVNHAELAGHTAMHEFQMASNVGKLGSIDANSSGNSKTGGSMVWWDTDMFPGVSEAIEAMLVIIKQNGLRGGGVHFDAKTHRTSTNLEDMFHAHILGMDSFAKGLIIAFSMLGDQTAKKLLEARYQSSKRGYGLDIMGSMSLEQAAKLDTKLPESKKTSGRLEVFERILANHVALAPVQFMAAQAARGGIAGRIGRKFFKALGFVRVSDKQKPFKRSEVRVWVSKETLTRLNSIGITTENEAAQYIQTVANKYKEYFSKFTGENVVTTFDYSNYLEFQHRSQEVVQIFEELEKESPMRSDRSFILELKKSYALVLRAVLEAHARLIETNVGDRRLDVSSNFQDLFFTKHFQALVYAIVKEAKEASGYGVDISRSRERLQFFQVVLGSLYHGYNAVVQAIESIRQTENSDPIFVSQTEVFIEDLKDFVSDFAPKKSKPAAAQRSEVRSKVGDKKNEKNTSSLQIDSFFNLLATNPNVTIRDFSSRALTGRKIDGTRKKRKGARSEVRRDLSKVREAYMGVNSSTQSFTITVGDENGVFFTHQERFEQEKYNRFDSPEGFIRSANQQNPERFLMNPLMIAFALEESMKALQTFAKESTLDLKSIKAIAPGGQQHALVYLTENARGGFNRFSGKSVEEQMQQGGYLAWEHSAIWKDKSTGLEGEKLVAAFRGQENLLKETGSEFQHRFAAGQVAKFAKEHPKQYENTESILTLPAYIGYLLSGYMDFPWDAGEAIPSHLGNLKTRTWHVNDKLDQVADGLSEKLPAVEATDVLVASMEYYWTKYGFSSDVYVANGTGDNPANLIGMGMIDSDMTISLGTSFVISTKINTKKDLARTLKSKIGNMMGSPFGKWMKLVCFQNGGLALKRIRDQHITDEEAKNRMFGAGKKYSHVHYLEFDSDRVKDIISAAKWEIFEEELKKTQPGNNGAMMITQSEDEKAINVKFDPKKPYASGNLDLNNRPQALRAAVEGQIYFLKYAAERAGLNLSGIKQINLTGGASKNASIRQIIADVFNAEVKTLEGGVDSVSLGMLINARRAYTSESKRLSWRKASESLVKFQAETTKPVSKNVQAYQQNFPAFVKMVEVAEKESSTPPLPNLIRLEDRQFVGVLSSLDPRGQTVDKAYITTLLDGITDSEIQAFLGDLLKSDREAVVSKVLKLTNSGKGLAQIQTMLATAKELSGLRLVHRSEVRESVDVKPERVISALIAPSKDAEATIKTLIDSGLRVGIEIAFRGGKRDETIRLIRFAADYKKAKNSPAIIQAGTVLNFNDAQSAIEAGASTIITPGLTLSKQDIKNIRHYSGVRVVMGVGTPDEARSAVDRGVNEVKVFPFDQGDLVKALSGPLPRRLYESSPTQSEGEALLNLRDRIQIFTNDTLSTLTFTSALNFLTENRDGSTRQFKRGLQKEELVEAVRKVLPKDFPITITGGISTKSIEDGLLNRLNVSAALSVKDAAAAKALLEVFGQSRSEVRRMNSENLRVNSVIIPSNATLHSSPFTLYPKLSRSEVRNIGKELSDKYEGDFSKFTVKHRELGVAIDQFARELQEKETSDVKTISNWGLIPQTWALHMINEFSAAFNATRWPELVNGLIGHQILQIQIDQQLRSVPIEGRQGEGRLTFDIYLSNDSSHQTRIAEPSIGIGKIYQERMYPMTFNFDRWAFAATILSALQDFEKVETAKMRMQHLLINRNLSTLDEDFLKEIKVPDRIPVLRALMSAASPKEVSGYLIEQLALPDVRNAMNPTHLERLLQVAESNPAVVEKTKAVRRMMESDFVPFQLPGKLIEASKLADKIPGLTVVKNDAAYGSVVKMGENLPRATLFEQHPVTIQILSVTKGSVYYAFARKLGGEIVIIKVDAEHAVIIPKMVYHLGIPATPDAEIRVFNGTTSNYDAPISPALHSSIFTAIGGYVTAPAEPSRSEVRQHSDVIPGQTRNPGDGSRIRVRDDKLSGNLAEALLAGRLPGLEAVSETRVSVPTSAALAARTFRPEANHAEIQAAVSELTRATKSGNPILDAARNLERVAVSNPQNQMLSTMFKPSDAKAGVVFSLNATPTQGELQQIAFFLAIHTGMRASVLVHGVSKNSLQQLAEYFQDLNDLDGNRISDRLTLSAVKGDLTGAANQHVSAMSRFGIQANKVVILREGSFISDSPLGTLIQSKLGKEASLASARNFVALWASLAGVTLDNGAWQALNRQIADVLQARVGYFEMNTGGLHSVAALLSQIFVLERASEISA